MTQKSRGFALLDARPVCPAWALLKEEQDRAALEAIVSYEYDKQQETELLL